MALTSFLKWGQPPAVVCKCLLQNAALPAYCISRFSTNSQPPPYKLVRF